jgi:capsular polysaccharide transport system permease protein
LSETARTDTTRYANEDLATAEDRLKAARQALTAFRLKNQIVDPSADVQSQVGILGQLQSQLAEALITLDLLRGSANANDPRITNAEERISVIEKRIEQERQKFGAGGQGAGNEDFATVVDEYERLNADRDFAQGKYVAAMTALDAARAEAQRQSRYLAAFVRPTLAQTAEYPRRALLSLLAFLFLTLGWSIGALIYYSIRDRR